MENTNVSGLHGHRLSYRTDIQGLRAVAILLVVAAHAKITGFSGGFVGVDVFFVLSGYLITGLLTQEFAETGSIRFADFYARRFLRLLPALLTMLAFSCAGAAIILLPGAQDAQASAAAAASVWASNFYFAFSNIDYFAPSAESNIFLHTWSLGVEEQFYLVWPTLLLIICALSGSSRGQQLTRVKTGMILIAAISLFSCITSTPHSPELAFYMMPWRAWQFALGALVMLHRDANGRIANSGSHPVTRHSGKSALLGWLGLAMIVGSGILFRPNFAYPGAWALVPSLGAAGVLALGSTRQMKSGVGALLSWSPLQYLGRVSYSWYLWHWPVLLLGAKLLDPGHLENRVLLVMASLAIAELSYRLIESPIRRNRKLRERPAATVFFAVALMVVAATFSIRWSNAVASWLSQPEQKHYASTKQDAPSIYGFGCDDWYHSAEVKFCQFGNERAKHTAIMIGDSIGLQWFPAVATVFDNPEWRLLVVTKSSCPIVDEPYFYARIGREYTECSKWRNDALSQIQKIKPDVLIMGTSTSPTFSSQQWKEGTERVLAQVSPFAGHVYILRATPVLPFNGPDCLSGRSWRPRQLFFDSSCTASASNARSDEIFSALSLAARSFKNASMLDMNDSVCPGHLCSAEQGKLVVFRDSQHMTASFAESLSPQLKNQLNLGTLVPEKQTPN